MPEYHTVVKEQRIAYEGYFDFAKLWGHIRGLVEEMGYMYLEKEHTELNTEHGKELYVHADILTDETDYALPRVTITCTVHKLVDVEISKDGKKLTMNEGSLEIKFEASVITDVEGRFEKGSGPGWNFFIRVILEKFIFNRTITKYKAIAEQDTIQVIRAVKRYLNLEGS